jgi:hypothetical protein
MYNNSAPRDTELGGAHSNSDASLAELPAVIRPRLPRCEIIDRCFDLIDRVLGALLD